MNRLLLVAGLLLSAIGCVHTKAKCGYGKSPSEYGCQIEPRTWSKP